MIYINGDGHSEYGLFVPYNIKNFEKKLEENEKNNRLNYHIVLLSDKYMLSFKLEASCGRTCSGEDGKSNPS
ncbi:hypothetical protein ACFL2G_03120 [Candidatus Omnitrophota bacterium]